MVELSAAFWGFLNTKMLFISQIRRDFANLACNQKVIWNGWPFPFNMNVTADSATVQILCPSLKYQIMPSIFILFKCFIVGVSYLDLFTVENRGLSAGGEIKENYNRDFFDS